MMSLLACQRLHLPGRGREVRSVDRFAFHGHVDLDVLAGGGDADMSEPGLDHVELDTGLE